MLDPARSISFDIETQGTRREYALQPWRVAQKKAWISTIAAYHVDGNHTSDPTGHVYPNKSQIAAVLEQAIDENRPMLGWNITFDVAWLIAYGLEKLVMRALWLDGMRLWRHMYVEPEYDLTRATRKKYRLKGPGGAVQTFAPEMDGYEDDIDYQTRDPEGLARLLEYNKNDVIAAYIATQKIWAELSEQQRKAAVIEAGSIPFIAKANLTGMLVDADALQAADDAMTEQLAKSMAVLSTQGITSEVIRSPRQLEKVIFDQWGLQPIKFGKPVDGVPSRSTDKETLHELSVFDGRAKTLRQWREALNLKSKFISSISESVEYNADGRTHPQAILFGTYSGRLTYSSYQGKGTKEDPKYQTGFALHQMKNDKRFRAMIQAPEGYDMGELDAAGQEFRWMAIASGDENMLQLCLPGEDPHSFMGSRADPDVTHDYDWVRQHKETEGKAIRKMGKVGNLSLQYRTSAPKLMTVARVQYDIPMVLEEAKELRSVYLDTYPGVPLYWSKQIEFGQRHGYAETFAGRRVQIPGQWTRHNPLKWAMESTMINYPIQGTGADQKYLAMLCLKDFCVANGIYFAFDLHDGLYWYIPKANSKGLLLQMKQILDHLPYTKAWGLKPPIPLPFDAKLGPSWGQLKEVEA